MKRVFAYVGTRNINSRTKKNTEIILETLEKKYPRDISYEILSPNDIHINPSTGCKNCFTKGLCPIDSDTDDHGSIIKQKMLDADFIIFSSPVYSHNVSSDMKALVDRLSYWGHIFKLAGKSGIVLATASSNGVHFVTDYLEKVASIMGLNVIDKIAITEMQPLKEKHLNYIADNIYEYITNTRNILIDERMEISFQTYKQMFISYPKEHAEYQYWKNSGLFNASSLQEYIDSIVNNKAAKT